MPLPSISAYVDRELEMFTVDDGFELRHGDQPLASLGDGRHAATVECVTGDGEWLFSRLRGGNSEALQGGAVVATYKSGLIPGGKIELTDGTRHRLRPPVLRRPWRVPHVLDIHSAEGPWLIAFGPRAREVYHLPLLTTFAFHAMIVEIDQPLGGSGYDGGF